MTSKSHPETGAKSASVSHSSAATATKATAADTVLFKDLAGISDKMLAVLEKHGYVTPTPIQAKVIPIGIEGKDIIGIAQTGTGKTLGFGIPMIERLLADRAIKKDSRGLVILPTRELALQVDETLRKLGATAGMNLGIHTAVLIGGDSMGRQIRDLRNGPDIVIATPGRLIDHLKQGNIKFDRVSIIVLDEADHMFDIGFAPQIREIMKKVPAERQTLLFSATMPNEIAKLAMEHMKLPLRIEVAPQGTAAQNVEQEIIVVSRGSKFNLLVKMIGEHPGQPIIVFTRTKHGAKDISTDLNRIGTKAVEIHSNRTLAQRRAALDGFKRHTFQVLVATDIAARGIDVKDIGLVVNYDLPEQSEDYVHRIGRTGRAGKSGKAVSFATPDQKYDIMKIERLVKKTLPMKSHEGAVMGASQGPRMFRGGYGRGGGYGGSRGGSTGGRSSGGYGGYARGYAGRPAPASAFRTNTNQAFKGGAPRAAAGSSYAPRATSYTPRAASSYTPRAGAGFTPRPGYAPRTVRAFAQKPFASKPYAGRSSGARSGSASSSAPRSSSGPSTGGTGNGFRKVFRKGVR